MKTRNYQHLLYYIIFFFLSWIIIRVMLLWNYFQYNSVINSLLSHGIKATLWILPVMTYVIIIDKHVPITYLKLNKNIFKGIAIGITVSFLMILFNIGYVFLLGDKNLNFDIDWIGILLIGLLEEIPFRGFLMQKFQEYMSFIKANILQAFLFLLIHFPGWIRIFHGDIFRPQLWIYIFIFGLFLGYIFKRSNSLWSCIIIHSINNLIAIIIR